MKFDGIEKRVICYETEPCQNNEVEVYQHTGTETVRLCFAPVGEECHRMAKDMLIEAEVLTNGELTLYVRWHDGHSKEDGLCRIVKNEPGNNEPNVVLARMITEKYGERHGQVS